MESSAGLPHPSDITNFGSLYSTWFGQEMTFVISKIRYKQVHYVEVLLQMQMHMHLSPGQVDRSIEMSFYVKSFYMIHVAYGENNNWSIGHQNCS